MKSTQRIVGKKLRKDGTRQERLSEAQKADKAKRGKKATGRPVFYGGDIWEELLCRMQGGETVTSICRDDHMPSRREVTRKASKDKDFSLAYARARLDAADAAFDGLVDEVRNAQLRGDPVEAQRLRLLVDTQKWVLSHVNPRKYADKVDFNPDEGKRPARVMIVGANYKEPEDE